MGLMSSVFGNGGKGGDVAASGSHKIDAATVHKATAGNVFNPMNPGSMQSIRTAPVCDNPRYFTPKEAEALQKLASEKRSQAISTVRAYKQLKTIDTADTTVHRAHYNYAGKVASNELSKLQGTNAYAKKLHALRPGYARMGIGLEKSEARATDTISAIKEGLRY